MASIEVQTRWLSRLFHVFRNSPNILSLIEILSDPLQDTVNVCDFILSHLSIDEAEGVQLEILGGLIGVGRPLAQEERVFQVCALGETGDPQNDHGFYNTDDDPPTGGYLSSINGIPSNTAPGSTMSDTDYRYLIRQKAASFRKYMTRLNLFNYLIAFGSRCQINDDEDHVVGIDPLTYNDLNEWDKWYVLHKGFKPAGIRTYFRDNIRKTTT